MTWCAELPSGERVHGLTWDGLEADERLISVPCKEHARPGHMFAGQVLPPADSWALAREALAHQARMALGQM